VLPGLADACLSAVRPGRAWWTDGSHST